MEPVDLMVWDLVESAQLGRPCQHERKGIMCTLCGQDLEPVGLYVGVWLSS